MSPKSLASGDRVALINDLHISEGHVTRVSGKYIHVLWTHSNDFLNGGPVVPLQNHLGGIFVRSVDYPGLHKVSPLSLSSATRTDRTLTAVQPRVERPLTNNQL